MTGKGRAEEQIIGSLQEGEPDRIMRSARITSGNAFLGVQEICELRQLRGLREENSRLKEIIANFTLPAQEIASKKRMARGWLATAF